MKAIALIMTLALGLLVAPLAAAAQPSAKVARIGYLSVGGGAGSPLTEAFRQGLHELADAIPEKLRRWTGQAAPQSREEELRARFATVWDAYVPEVSERTQAQRWIVSEALAASVCGYLAANAEERWDWEEATIEAQQTLELIMGAEVLRGSLPKLTPGALYAADAIEEWLLFVGTWHPNDESPEARP